MKPVDQTILGEPHGNCLQACVASILELALDDVPNFMEYEDWDGEFVKFMAGFGLEPVEFNVAAGWTPGGYHCALGETSRGILHSVVAHGGEVVHDPHPSKNGLHTVTAWMVFVATLEDGRAPSSNVGSGWLHRAVKGE